MRIFMVKREDPPGSFEIQAEQLDCLFYITRHKSHLLSVPRFAAPSRRRSVLLRAGQSSIIVWPAV